MFWYNVKCFDLSFGWFQSTFGLWKTPMRRHLMRFRRRGGGTGGEGRSVGSLPPLSIHDTGSHAPPSSNVTQFHFTNSMVRPRITATISIFFQEEPQDEDASGSRKRRRKSTIPTHQPQDTKKSASLPVKSSSTSSSSDDASSGSSAYVEKKLKDDSGSYSTLESSSQHSKGVDDDLKDYSCPIVEENSLTHIDS